MLPHPPMGVGREGRIPGSLAEEYGWKFYTGVDPFFTASAGRGDHTTPAKPRARTHSAQRTDGRGDIGGGGLGWQRCVKRRTT